MEICSVVGVGIKSLRDIVGNLSKVFDKIDRLETILINRNNEYRTLQGWNFVGTMSTTTTSIASHSQFTIGSL